MSEIGTGASSRQGRITPRRSYPKWHFAPAHTWDAQRIAAAMRRWGAETGDPPRSYDWCPSAARSACLIGPGEHKWEREHPRWPGNTTVYRYYGSWFDALAAAGLPPGRPPPDLPFAERVETARRLQDAGETVRAISDHLDVHPSSVYGPLRAHPCRECGGWVVGLQSSVTRAALGAPIRGDGPGRSCSRPARPGGLRSGRCRTTRTGLGRRPVSRGSGITSSRSGPRAVRSPRCSERGARSLRSSDNPPTTPRGPARRFSKPCDGSRVSSPGVRRRRSWRRTPRRPGGPRPPSFAGASAP